MALSYRDRRDAGQRLAAALAHYRGRPDVLVLGLPRGGVPVAFEVAEALEAPMDLFIVRKLGVPGHEELAMGAIASGGGQVLNRAIIEGHRVSDDALQQVAAAERQELARRERIYRGTRPPIHVRGLTVILVDDGLATGSTMQAAAMAVRQEGPARLVVAVPVGAPETCADLREVADDVVCLLTPEKFYAVGQWYDDFSPTSDAEVRELLAKAEERVQAAKGTGINTAVRGGSGTTIDTEEADPVTAVRAGVQPLTGGVDDYDSLLEMIGDARFVLIGEASHGTDEFYRERAAITKRLIRERGFTAVAVEADWPDAYRVNRYVRGTDDDADANEALAGFKRFPQWMWRNRVVLDFVECLRLHNDGVTAGTRKAGFYGLDLYSLHASIDAVITYLDKVDPEAARRARLRYSCFEDFGDDPQAYGYMTELGSAEPCEEDAVNQLLELQRRATELTRRDGRVAEDEHFHAEQNARLAMNAEAYYRSMFRGRVSSWNLRDRHMAETLDALVDHLDKTHAGTKVVVWAHNSHLGDARATDMGQNGEWNLGQLVREVHGRESVLVGFSTYAGSVTAASDWGAPAERKRMRRGMPGSCEALFHEVAEVIGPRFLIPLRDGGMVSDALRESRLQRSIGVIYRPETERFSHYFYTQLTDQFDALIHIDETQAVEPLERTGEWDAGEPPETYPFGE